MAQSRIESKNMICGKSFINNIIKRKRDSKRRKVPRWNIRFILPKSSWMKRSLKNEIRRRRLNLMEVTSRKKLVMNTSWCCRIYPKTRSFVTIVVKTTSKCYCQENLKRRSLVVNAVIGMLVRNVGNNFHFLKIMKTNS